MSRPRRHSPGGGMVFHVLNRGLGRRLLFTKDEDFLAFERVVEETLRPRRMRLCAYCLMPKHWHFVAWFKRRSQLRGGWGRRPKGDAPRSEAGALGAR